MLEELAKCSLFTGLDFEELKKCLVCSGARHQFYKAGQIVFEENDMPKYIYVLVKGKIALCKDSFSGRRNLATTFEVPGEMFGEAYAFLDHHTYDYYTVAVEDSELYEIPKIFLSHTCTKSCGYHERVIYNMIHILAEKNFNLNRKLQVLAANGLRQKIAMMLLRMYTGEEEMQLGMNREELADYLGTARPSLSRELMKMKEEGLIDIKGKKIRILNKEGLENCL